MPDRSVPVVALDVDGVLNPLPLAVAEPVELVCRLDDYVEHWVVLEPGVVHNEFLRGAGQEGLEAMIRLSPTHGAWIRSLLDRGVEVVWSTTWEEHANRVVAPLLGIPELPVGCTYDGDSSAGHWHPEMLSDHYPSRWKARVLRSKYRGRALAWVDDAIDSFIELRQDPTLTVGVDDRVGLTAAQMDEVETWLHAVDSAAW